MSNLDGILAAALVATSIPAAAEGPVEPGRPPLPSISEPIAVTAQSRPWAGAADSVEPIDLAAHGFVEEEYVVAGVARVLDWPSVDVLRELARGPYTTRILVRRPADAAAFSGTVVVEPLNPSIRYDLPLIWGSSHDHFLRHGDIWVGVTVKPVAVAALKEFDAARYASLGFPNPLPPERTCGQNKLPMPRGGLPAESTPATENGLMWDALAQVGALFKDSRDTGAFAAFRATRLYLAGDSQSGGFVFNYAQALHRVFLTGEGDPLWDGYLATVATGPGLPMHQCAEPIPRGDPRLTIRPVGVPLIAVASQSEMRSLRRRPDSDHAPDLFRGYEVAGSSHIHEGDDAGTPSESDIARTSGAGLAVATGCSEGNMPGNDVPFGFALNAMIANLEEWTTRGTPPPYASPMAVSDPGTAGARPVLDAVGNILGGVRTPQVDVPVARYRERMAGPGICELWGWREPLAQAELTALYGGKAGYLERFRASVAALVADRWLEPADGAVLVERAEQLPFR